MIDIQSLRYVVTLAEELHFGRAARRHYIAAQAFGRRIQRAERELGATLFERTSRRVTITPAGERVVSQARRILAHVDELARVGATDPPADGGLRVGILGFGLADRWPLMLELLAARRPGLRVHYVDMDWDTQYDAVRYGEVDVSIAHDIGPEDGLVADPVLNVGRFAVVPQHSELAHSPGLSMDDVADHQWVRPIGRHPGLADWAGPACSSSRTSIEVRTPGMVPAAVATTGQLGIHGDPARWFFAHPQVRYVPLAGAPAIVSVVSREHDRRPAVLAFRRAAQALAALERAGPVCGDHNRLGT